jgi:hypothetical protein
LRFGLFGAVAVALILQLISESTSLPFSIFTDLEFYTTISGIAALWYAYKAANIKDHE